MGAKPISSTTNTALLTTICKYIHHSSQAPHKYQWRKVDKLGAAFSFRHGMRNTTCIQNFSWKTWREDAPYKSVDVEMITLKRILMKQIVCERDLPCPGKGPVAGFVNTVSEISNTINARNFLTSWMTTAFSRTLLYECSSSKRQNYESYRLSITAVCPSVYRLTLSSVLTGLG